jgi:hypothetical protein
MDEEQNQKFLIILQYFEQIYENRQIKCELIILNLLFFLLLKQLTVLNLNEYSEVIPIVLNLQQLKIIMFQL